MKNNVEIITDEDEKKIKKEKELYSGYNEKKKSGILPYIFIVILLLIILGGLLFLIFKTDVFKNKNNKDTSSQKEKITLKHSKTSEVKSDGVYITDVSDIVDEVMPSIVSITSKTIIDSGRFGPYYYGGLYKSEGAGSGIIVSESDKEIYILTNNHVVKETDELSVSFIDGTSAEGKIKGVSDRKDIAIVSVEKSKLDTKTLEEIKIATLGSSDELKVGNGIIAIGNALGYGQSVTTGVVSALNRELTTSESSQDMIQIDAAINGGNSGGALLNSKGEVVGINTAKYSSNSLSSSASIEGMGFAIPISDVEDIIEKLINGEEDDSELYLGVEGYMTNGSYISAYNLPTGFYISSIVKDSNASSSDLEIGNIITKIDGKEVDEFNDIRKVLDKKEKGDSVTLTVKYVKGNEYKEREVTIKLEK
ncbi:MAG: trypsin-like peptidase domain-containing protein [Bacilli bacterium]|nr:trypsin-like peptidase domain-containing protein [Bacilli bacterium]